VSILAGTPPKPAKARVTPPRTDPRRRHIDGTARWMRLDRKTVPADRKLVFVNKDDPHGGVQYYLSLGYQVETWRKDGIRVAAIPPGPEGTEIQHNGQVLMSIDLEAAALIDKEGPDGNTGSDLLDERDRRIVSKRNVNDEMRGLHARWMSFANESSPLELEQANG
jgi:hypothetical protein